MANRIPITVRLESFEGPLDLLLYLIQSHELDITKVSISKITDQYLAYVRLMQELNFDTASEFLVMAATLILWKSKSLLPNEDKLEAGAEAELELSQDDLIRQLMEHQRFLEAGQNLAQLSLLGEDVFARQNPKPPTHAVWKEMDLSQLTTTYQDILVRARKRTQVLKKETVSISETIMGFSSRLKPGMLTDLRDLLATGARPETVVTFLASLELSRLKKMRLHQEATYGPIMLELLETLSNFDMTLASGFESEIASALNAVDHLQDIPAHLPPPPVMSAIPMENPL